MHVHVPYCPQICSFCHCGRRLLKHRDQLEEWLDRTLAEIDFFAREMKSTHVRHQYFGGGTPDLLSPDQLDRLLHRLEDRFDHTRAMRRTFEILPSNCTREVLEVAVGHGIRRISGGVQSVDGQVLAGVSRAPDLAPLRRIIADARVIGIADINIDLAWGLAGDSEAQLYTSLQAVLALEPESVSIHLLAPTPLHPVYASDDEEVELYERFLALPKRAFPGYVWKRLPTVMVLAREEYVEAGHYYSWMYSDMETLGCDLFALGRHGLSHIRGRARYENVSPVSGPFDPRQPAYRISRTDGTVDGAIDTLSDLLRDQVCDFTWIRELYGAESTLPVVAAMDKLVEDGALLSEAGVFRDPRGPTLFLGELSSLLELARSQTRALNGAPEASPTASQTTVTVLPVGDGVLPIVVETADPTKDYYATIDGFGFYHEEPKGLERPELAASIVRITEDLEEIILGRALSEDQVRAELEQRWVTRAADR
jgi:hypothetical protein